MKATVFRMELWLAVSSLLLGQIGRAAVNFTITPSAISNTDNGTITLQVTGLTNTETVVVQKFLDANGNGAVDAPDLLVRQFNLTDGAAGMVIGGVTNFNVPGDTDGSANGQITAQLHPSFNFVQVTVGKYLFVLSSPAGHFAPQTKSFSVTNFPYAQTISGNVVNSGTNVPDAIVILFPGNSGGNGPGTPAGGTVANNSGAYTLQVPPGTYVPLAFKSNYVGNFGTSPVLTVNASQSVVTNLTLTNATPSISGQVVDFDNHSLGLPGLTVPLLSDSGLIAVGFTDTNGNFNVPVTAGSWNVNGSAAGSFVGLGYVGYADDYSVSSGASGILLPVHKASALFYGSVKDNSGNPLPGIDISSGDYDDNYSVDDYSDANGNYVVGIIGGLGSGDPWQVQISSDSSPANYIFSQPTFNMNGGTNMTVGNAVLQNFTGILATNHISGHVQFNGTNVVGVQVVADATIGGLNYQAQMDTDDSGNYSLNVGNGTWNVSVLQCCDNDSLDHFFGSGNYQPPASQNITIANNNGTADFTVQPCNGVQFLTGSPLPNGTNGVYYSLQLQASSCNDNFTWNVNNPGNLPPGLTLYSGGVLNGTPTGTGTFHFTVHVQDNAGFAVNTNLTLMILAGASPLQITTTSLPNGNFGVAYTSQLSATGGQPGYNWSLAAGSQPLPAGLSLSSGGSISGTPATNGLFNFIVQVTDAGLNTATQPLGLVINPKPNLVSPAKISGSQFQFLLSGAANQNYTLQYSSNLLDWTSLLITNNPATGSFLVTVPNATNAEGFYRVLIGP